MDWTAINAVASAVTALAVLVAVLQLRGARQQAHRDFENLYVQRYWTIWDSFSAGARKRVPRKQFKEKDQAPALAYLQLCEDEIDMRSLGRVTNDTWSFWGPAIVAELSQAPYQNLLNTYDRRFKGLRELLNTGRDPLLWRFPRRWVSGL